MRPSGNSVGLAAFYGTLQNERVAMKRIASAACAVFLIGSLCSGQVVRDSLLLASLVETERSFARTSIEKGIRASFMAFFADDAVVFRPHPVKYKEAMKSVPAPKNPLEVTLQWEPLYADMSVGGDMGYTTGPSVWTDNSPAKRPTYNGFYFSVWKKQPTGEWKVVFDIGTEQPGPYNESRTVHYASPVRHKEAAQNLKPEEHRASLMYAERNFLALAQKGGALKALGRCMDDEARVYRGKERPIAGRNLIQAYFSGKRYLSTWEPMQCDVAKSGDLGYVCGSYTTKASGGGSVVDEKGYYVRVWRRDAMNEWRVVAEVISPLPPEAPKGKQ